MSPEQAAGEVDALGPPTDVYGLGAILFALLTGEPPVEGGAVDEVLDRARRGAIRSPRSLNSNIPRALEALCIRAVALRPEDRYPTARALADDLERWLADEPVSAWREPLSSRARRWARRNRTAVIGAATALLTGSLGLAAVAAMQALHNGELTKANSEIKQALADTREQKEKAAEALSQSEAVRTFLVEAFRSSDPEQDGREIRVAEVLDRAARRLDKEFRGSEATRGALLDALGQTFEGLGLPDAAVDLMARAGAVRWRRHWAQDHLDTLKTRMRIVGLYAEYAGRLAGPQSHWAQRRSSWLSQSWGPTIPSHSTVAAT